MLYFYFDVCAHICESAHVYGMCPLKEARRQSQVSFIPSHLTFLRHTLSVNAELLASAWLKGALGPSNLPFSSTGRNKCAVVLRFYLNARTPNWDANVCTASTLLAVISLAHVHAY